MPSKGTKVKKNNIDSSIPGTLEHTAQNIHDLNLTRYWTEHGYYPLRSSANQHPVLGTPNSSGIGTIFHTQVGDLHTPTGMYLPTPLSFENTIPSVSQTPCSHGFEPLNPQVIANHIHEINPRVQEALYSPCASMRRDSGYHASDDSADTLSISGLQVEAASNISSPTVSSVRRIGDLSYVQDEQ